MAYTSEVDIANRALHLLSSGFITGFGDGSKQGTLSGLVYSQAYAIVARDVMPSLFIHREILVPANVSSTVYPEYMYAYATPADMLLPLKLISNRIFDIKEGIILTDDNGWGYGNATGNVVLEYIRKRRDVVNWPEETCFAIAAKMAYLMCDELVGGKDKDDIENTYNNAVIEAKRQNGQFRKGRRLRNPMWGEFPGYGVSYGQDGNASWTPGGHTVGTRGTSDDVER